MTDNCSDGVTEQDPIAMHELEPQSPYDEKVELDSLIREIQADASDDPLQYLLRSNTSHDGE